MPAEQDRLDEMPPLVRREPLFNVPAVVIALIAVLFAVHVVRLLLPHATDQLLLWTFAFVPARYEPSLLPGAVIPGGTGAEIWSFFSYALIHGDWMHLVVNTIWLLAFGSPLARRFGTARFVAFCLVTVAAGAAAHLATHVGTYTPVIGASAAVSGMMGAATRFVFQPGGPLTRWRSDGVEHIPAAPLWTALRNPAVIAFLAVWFGLNLLFGLGSLSIGGEEVSVAWEAHVGGFVAGLLLFSAFDRPSDIGR